MFKSGFITLAVLMTIAIAAPTHASITFDVDFWATENPVHNYIRDEPGAGDLGAEFKLLPGEQINVDLYFSTDETYIAGSWKLQYDPADLVMVSATTPADAPWALPIFDVTPGSITYEDVIFPPGATITGNNHFFGSILFECAGPGDVELNLSNHLGFLTTAGQDPIEEVHLGTLHQTPVPAALWLLGSGLVGMLGLRRKTASKNTP